MSVRPLRVVIVVLAFTGRSLFAITCAAPEEISFNRDIRPILSENCFLCHGPDKAHRQAELRLDVREIAVAAGAIVEGDPENSEIITRIFSDDPELVMPPTDSHKSLTPEQKTTLKRWIQDGARYQRHWSYEPPVKPQIPEGHNAIDVLVQKRLGAVGLTPSPEADRRTLMRRLSFDLIGLPPSPEDVRAFEADASQGAYGQLVDRLLTSPHYGERMAIGWLDVVRFADTIGYHSDTPRNVWPYRDWVIRSFNDNKPFDRFTIEQIAGDLLPDANQESRIGSAFNRLLMSTEEGGAQPKDYESRMVADRVRAIGTAWLGLTTGCAQCHDHKFDAFTTRDFYSLGAFFADIQEGSIGKREDGMPITTEEQQQQLEMLDAVIAASTQQDDKEALQKTQAERQALVDSLPMCLVSVSSSDKRIVRILPRGNWMDETGEIVKPALPQFLQQPVPLEREQTRVHLAQWLVSRDNPLTARTVMNRLWKQFFGMGLSKSADDLGAQGELPFNQELLDWLACEFMDSGWDMKHMVRTIVTSAAYRQVSTATPEQLNRDPYNREHARQSRFRLDAELVRDNALAISGLLVSTIGGPSVKPYQPAGYWENLNFPTRDYVPDSGEGQYRRGIYIWWQRTFLHPSLVAFDAPSREECSADRSRSNIPQQALVLLNDPTFAETHRALAARILNNADGTAEQKIEWAWQQVLQRKPNGVELKQLRDLFERHAADYRRDPNAAAVLLQTGPSSAQSGNDAAELAAWAHVARVLLNLHETITRN